MRNFLLCLGLALAIIKPTYATPELAPQPVSCIKASFSSNGSQYWQNINLKITNECTTAIDFQNTTITFSTQTALNTSFWGNFSPLSYPDTTNIVSQKQDDGTFLVSLPLHFPTAHGTTSLPAGNSITIQYGAEKQDSIPGSFKFYTDGTTNTGGNIILSNNSSKPNDVSQSYALAHVTSAGKIISDVKIPWNNSQTLSNLTPGLYTIAAENVTGSTSTYLGTASPPSVTVTANNTVSSTINYSAVVDNLAGKININVATLPIELTGYTQKPIVTLLQQNTGTSSSATLNWNTTTTIGQLKPGSSYTLSTPIISYSTGQCNPIFTPATIIANDKNIPSTTLTYICVATPKIPGTISVNGAPNSLSTLKVTFTPTDGKPSVSQNVTLSNGQGTQAVSLSNGIYQVSAEAVAGYSFTFNPQPLTVSPNFAEKVTLTAAATGTPVARNGQLKVCGLQLCNESGVPVQLKGMSTHGLQWYGWNKCITTGSLDALANNWKADVVRISMYVQEGGYETNPAGFTNQVNTIIDEVTKRGMYALVDFHQLDPGNPNDNLANAKKFFTDIATANKGKNNLIYDIANEPNGVSWATIKNYADSIIPIIRAIDPKTVILVGTHGWSSMGVSDGKTYQDIVNQPLTFQNIMYTFHFYAASHQAAYLTALDKSSSVLPVFVTEWGTQTYTGDGTNDFTMSDKFIDLMARKKIGWTNWNYSDDFRSGAVWKSGTCKSGVWSDTNLKPAGAYVKSKILQKTS